MNEFLGFFFFTIPEATKNRGECKANKIRFGVEVGDISADLVQCAEYVDDSWSDGIEPATSLGSARMAAVDASWMGGEALSMTGVDFNGTVIVSDEAWLASVDIESKDEFFPRWGDPWWLNWVGEGCPMVMASVAMVSGWTLTDSWMAENDGAKCENESIAKLAKEGMVAVVVASMTTAEGA